MMLAGYGNLKCYWDILSAIGTDMILTRHFMCNREILMLVGDLTCKWDILSATGIRKMLLGHLKVYRDKYDSNEKIYV